MIPAINKWTMKSTIEEIYNSPIGNELLSFIAYYSGKSVSDFNKFYLRKLNLNSHMLIQRITRIPFDRSLVNWILEKLNQFEDYGNFDLSKKTFDNKWWKESIIYQIFVPSFQDSNDDGIGDIQGIINRFEHLLSLNIQAILLSPIFSSPMHDAGYDVMDYYEINPYMGSKNDLQRLIALCKEHQIKLILSLPISQTSDQHSWLKNKLSKTNQTGSENYYIVNDTPNNWQSFYGDSAWLYQRIDKKYYLHLKSSKQLDLNWDLDTVRKEMINIMLYWQDFGVDGLFLQSASVIAKDSAYPEGSRTLANLTGVSGIEHYIYQPKLLTWLNEIYVALKVASPDFLIMAECIRMHDNYIKILNGDATKRSDLGLSYNQFEDPGEKRFQSNFLSLDYLSSVWLKTQNSADNNYWPVLFCEDSRHPRIVSRIENNNVYRTQIAKLIATMQLTAKGTILLYQGQELGQVNAPFHSMDQIRDIESQLRYEKSSENPNLIEDSETLDRIIRGSRDHARVPISWDNDSLNGDFSRNEKTWIDCFADPGMSVAEQANDSHSVLNFYRTLTSLRLHYPTLIYGELIHLNTGNNNILRYFRYDDKHAFYIEANLTDEQLNVTGFSAAKLIRKFNQQGLSIPQNFDKTIMLSNYPDRNQQDFIKNSILFPYEIFVVRLY